VLLKGAPRTAAPAIIEHFVKFGPFGAFIARTCN